MNDWVQPAGSTGDDQFSVQVRPGDAGWSHTGLLVADLAAGESRTIQTGDCEYLVLPLSGAAVVEVTSGEQKSRFELAGRQDVWSSASDLIYVPRDSTFMITSVDGGRYALPHAIASDARPVCKIDASDVPDELRGTGNSSRQVRNFGTPATLEADSIIACEVITPAGNWSSYPPHKHDQERPGVETDLEEIYYFETRDPRADADPATAPVGYMRVYASDERPIDVLAEVRGGDVVLVPYGWHGPAVTPPSTDMYYLNVMAGPGTERAWLICDDPAHGWVREIWPDQPVDPRLPFTR